jgi:hypothetical protein
MTMAQRLQSSALALLFVLCPLSAQGHPRDELGQASYVGITSTAVTIELNLTPGDKLASAFATLAEKPDYPQRVLSDLTLSLDGIALPLHLVKWQLPEHESLRRGEQSVRLFLQAPLAALAGGKHTLRFQNFYAPVKMKNGYLATTLTGTDGIRIGKQIHNSTQQKLTIEFQAPTTSLSQSLSAGFIGVLLALCGGYGWYRRR